MFFVNCQELEKFVIPMEKELEAARPKIQTYNEFLDAEGTANTTTIEKSFGLPSGRLLNEINNAL